jgi:ribosomal protein S18 acetylase RimI-like enzyme
VNAAAPAVTGLVCRKATRADLPRLVEMLADDEFGRKRETPGDPVYASAFAAIDADSNQLLLVGELAGSIVAMLQLTFIPGLSRRGAWRAEIESVRVARDLRGRGIGEWLIRQALQFARERGCGLAQLTSDKRRTEAQRFYGRLGFSASHEGFKLALERRE